MDTLSVFMFWNAKTQNLGSRMDALAEASIFVPKNTFALWNTSQLAPGRSLHAFPQPQPSPLCSIAQPDRNLGVRMGILNVRNSGLRMDALRKALFFVLSGTLSLRKNAQHLGTHGSTPWEVSAAPCSWRGHLDAACGDVVSEELVRHVDRSLRTTARHR